MKSKFYIIFNLTLFFCFFIARPIGAAGMDPVSKYAWGDKMGWINFNPDGGGVLVEDTAVSGQAWSSNYAWINLAPSNSGVKNDGEGNLSGYAWSESLGWINFAGVSINDGFFSGQAVGSESGIINFDCDHCSVRTIWRPVTASVSSPAIIPVYPQSAVVNIPVVGGQAAINSNSYNISIPLSGGSDVKGFSVSPDQDFINSSIEPFQDNLNFNICPSGDCPQGEYSLWLKFYGPTGHSSEATKITVNYNNTTTKVSACTDNRNNFLKIEKDRLASINLALSRRLSGRILLQVEEAGRAWYIYPKTLQRHYLGCPQDAFKIMRELSLGISNKDFINLTVTSKKRLAGFILLKVEDNGRAYYVNPVDLKLYYLGRPDDARLIMRELALGITNNDLSHINIAE